MRIDDVDWMKATCWRCDNVSERETRCGPLCAGCLGEYRRDYVEYKSITCYVVQRSLRKRFANKWFMNEMDDCHEWAIDELTRTKVAPGFMQKDFSNVSRRPKTKI